MADSAPMPGSTPIRLPTSTPKNDQTRLCGSSAMPKPYHRSTSDWCMAHRPQLNSGNCNCSAHQNTTTHTTTMASASTVALFHVFWRSPSAEMNTTAKVAGSRPPYTPSTTNATMLAPTQNQPRHSGGSTTSSPSYSVKRAVTAMANPVNARMTPSATGKKPGPMWLNDPM